MDSNKIFAHAPVKTSDIIGTDVVNSKGENLGNIKEIVLAPGTGRIAYVVVSFGGFLGLGEKLFAIPFSSFVYNSEEEEYLLEVPKAQLESASGFDDDNWPVMSDEKWNRNTYQHYGQRPYWE